MNAISEILPLSRVLLHTEASSKKRLLEQVAQLFQEQLGLPAAAVFDCLFTRERLGSTALGHGVAIPHGRHAQVQAACGAFIRLKEAVDFDAPDGKPVSLVFVLLVPEEATSEHLEILSHLATRFAEKNVRDALLSTNDAVAARQLLIE